MQQRALLKPANRALFALVLLLAIFFLKLDLASAEPRGEDAIAAPSQAKVMAGSYDAAASNAESKFHLEVTLNSQPTNKVISFTDVGGKFAATRRELEEASINPPGSSAPDTLILLDDIPNLVYFYDAPAQRMDIVTGDENQIRKIFDARSDGTDRDPARADYGAVLNYSLYAGGTTTTKNIDVPEFNGASTTLDGRIFTPYGVLSQSAIVGQTINPSLDAFESNAIRLDTTYTYADEDDLIEYRGGDLITRGPAWSRPIRIGGAQVRRNFSMRPDLVTQLLPSFSGSAAVPSTVDVYVNNAKAYSKDVGAGPFQLNNLPAITGAGTARVVVRDASGQEKTEELSFYNSPELLRPGLLDFSLEGGFARRDFALRSSSYDDTPVASGSLKAGVYDNLTLEAHAEGGDGLANAGAGAIVNAGNLGIVSVAASGSNYKDKTGLQLYGSFDTSIGPVTIRGRSQRSYDGYTDLATITTKGLFSPSVSGFSNGGFLTIEPPKAVDSIGFSLPIDFDRSSIGVNFVHYEQQNGETSNFITATYSRPLLENASFYTTGYADVEDFHAAAVYAGINMPLDDGVSLTSGLYHRDGGTTGSVGATKSLGQSPGSWGWRVEDQEGSATYRSAELAYRSQMAKVKGSVRQDNLNIRTGVEVEGAIAAVGTSVFATNTIHDAFAVVDAGAPGVKIKKDNNVVGETDEDGQLLVPNLTSYQRNKLSIDPSNLPINADVPEVDVKVTPAFRSGIYVDFQVKRDIAAALIVLTDAAGSVLPAGSEAVLDGNPEPFLVGYDGQTYVTGLKATNTLTVKTDQLTCSVSFAYQPKHNAQQQLGPFACH